MVRSRYFDKFKEGLPRADGKVFAITGTTSGTGFVAARTIAELGGEVILLNRDSSRSTESLKLLREAVPNGKFVPIECDLQDFAGVRAAVSAIRKKYDKLYCLANNAGVMAMDDEATKDGYDIQMQTNHLSHFLLTAELFSLLEAEANACEDARIVNHSSIARINTPGNRLEEKYLGPNGGDLGGNSRNLAGGAAFVRYAHSKLANSVFTYALAERLEGGGSKVRAICAHPGGAKTNLASHLTSFTMTFIVSVFGPFLFQSQEDGAMGLIKGMLDPAAQNGVLYGPKRNRTKGRAVPNPPKYYEKDPVTMRMLWSSSEAATGVQFAI